MADKRFSLPSLFLLAASLVSLCPVSHVWADIPYSDYRIPLVDPYAILHRDTFSEDKAHGPFRLVETNGGTGFSWTDVVDNVEQMAVSGQYIVGKTKTGYFILTAKPNEKPAVFSTLQEWQAALASTGVPLTVQLNNPDVLATGLPDHELRPWNYRIMKGLLGFSDDMWSLILQLMAFAFVFLLGIRRPGHFLRGDAMLVGLIVNFIAQMVIAGGGPAAFVGFLGMPLFCCLTAFLGSMVGKIWRYARKPRVSPAGGK